MYWSNGKRENIGVNHRCFWDLRSFDDLKLQDSVKEIGGRILRCNMIQLSGAGLANLMGPFTGQTW